jgi:hypothetical protein
MLVLVLLFENCSHLQPAPMVIDTLPVKQVDKKAVLPRQVSNPGDIDKLHKGLFSNFY